MFRTLLLTLATLRHEVSMHILKEDNALQTIHKATILNSSVLPTIMGNGNEPEVEAARRVNEWSGESPNEGDFDFDGHFEELNLAGDLTISKPHPNGVSNRVTFEDQTQFDPFHPHQLPQSDNLNRGRDTTQTGKDRGRDNQPHESDNQHRRVPHLTPELIQFGDNHPPPGLTCLIQN